MRARSVAGTCGDLRGVFQLIPISCSPEHTPAKRVKSPRISPHLPADLETRHGHTSFTPAPGFRQHRDLNQPRYPWIPKSHHCTCAYTPAVITFPLVIEIGKVYEYLFEQSQLLTLSRWGTASYRKWESSSKAPKGYSTTQAPRALRGGRAIEGRAQVRPISAAGRGRCHARLSAWVAGDRVSRSAVVADRPERRNDSYSSREGRHDNRAPVAIDRTALAGETTQRIARVGLRAHERARYAMEHQQFPQGAATASDGRETTALSQPACAPACLRFQTRCRWRRHSRVVSLLGASQFAVDRALYRPIRRTLQGLLPRLNCQGITAGAICSAVKASPCVSRGFWAASRVQCSA